MVALNDLIQFLENATNLLDDLYELDDAPLPQGWTWDDILLLRDNATNFWRQLEDGEKIQA